MMENGIQKVILSQNSPISRETMRKLVQLKEKTFEEAINEFLPVPILGVILVKSNLKVNSVSVTMKLGMNPFSVNALHGKRIETIPAGQTLVVWPTLSSFLSEEEYNDLESKLIETRLENSLSLQEITLDINPKENLDMNTYTLQDESYQEFDPKDVFSENGEPVFVTDRLGSFYSNVVKKESIAVRKITLEQSLKRTLHSVFKKEKGIWKSILLITYNFDRIIGWYYAYPPAEKVFETKEDVTFTQPMCMTYTNTSSQPMTVTLDLDVKCSQILNSYEFIVYNLSLPTNPVLVLPTSVIQNYLNPLLSSLKQRILAFYTSILFREEGTVSLLSPKTQEGASLSEFLTKPVVEGFLYEVDPSILTDERFSRENAIKDEYDYPLDPKTFAKSRFKMNMMNSSLDLVPESDAQIAHVTSLNQNAILYMPSLLVIQESKITSISQIFSTF